MAKYVKVMYGLNSGADKNLIYTLNKVNISNNWNPNTNNNEDYGGFNFCDEESIIRWLHRGDTVYDVEIPEDADVKELEKATKIYRSNKIIIKNPRKMTDDLALYYYKISNIKEKSYYSALAVVSLMNYKNTALSILRDKVNTNNIDEVLKEWNDFKNHKGKNDRNNINDTMIMIERMLYEIKSDLLISINTPKDIYIKQLTNDNIINLTGQSGSGKSTYAKNNFNSDDYIIIDTDEIFSDSRFLNSTGLNKELGSFFRNKYDSLPDLGNDFDLIYNDILEYVKDIDKTVVIDSAQFHSIKDINLLKGKIIVLRTDIDTCFNRCINRWINLNKNYNEEELNNYKNKKLNIYYWYIYTNEFLKKIDSLK